MSEKTLKIYTRVIIGISILVPAIVAVLLFSVNKETDPGFNIYLMPKFHAILNSLTTILLILALISIRKKEVNRHKMFMLLAVLCSILFLGSYVTYHAMAPSTSYGGEGFLKYFYFIILISHIFLAAVVMPLVLFALLRALTGNFEKHRKIAKWAFPIWLYVAITGVLVFLLISPYYPA